MTLGRLARIYPRWDPSERVYAHRPVHEHLAGALQYTLGDLSADDKPRPM